MNGLNDANLHLPQSKITDGPRVSIIMPTFRRPHQIGESIRSLLDGEYQDFELLVRDDGNGSDGTAEAVVAAADGDSRLRYHRNPTNLGIAGNLNEGIRASRGELISVCHDHDLYRPAFLKAMVAALDHYPSALYVHCASEIIGQGGEHKGSNIHDFAELTPGHSWLRFMLSRPGCPVCALTLVRRSAHECYGLYNLTDGFITDVEMWMRLSRFGDVAYVREPHLQLRERERDHQAGANSFAIASTLARIHGRYIPLVYSGGQRAKARLRLWYWWNHIILLRAAQRLKHWLMDRELQRMPLEGA
jgi:glycosyltransferase involved in cell wall biosynthesis